MERVFISGIGTVSPLGNDWPALRQSLCQGQAGLGPLTRIDLTDLPVTIGGEVRGLDIASLDLPPMVSPKRMDLASQFAMFATQEALRDAGLSRDDLGDRAGVIIGAGLSGLETLQQQTEKMLSRGTRRVSPFTIPMLMPNAAPANISMAFGITGTGYTISSACSSSGHAMIDAYETIRRGDADIIVTGGTESSLTRLGIAAFCKMGAMNNKYNDQPDKAVRPFDADRVGLIMSEGSGMMIFESESSVRRRGVKTWAEIIGYGTSMDAYHLVQPDPEARQASRAIQQAVDKAGLNETSVGDGMYVNAHGTATTFNDTMETRALKSVFGEKAAKLQISGTKSMTGHLIGAACALEMIICALVLRYGVIPPTINLETPDPGCDLDYVPLTARESQIEYTLNNTFGFGGHNICLAMKSTR